MQTVIDPRLIDTKKKRDIHFHQLFDRENLQTTVVLFWKAFGGAKAWANTQRNQIVLIIIKRKYYGKQYDKLFGGK